MMIPLVDSLVCQLKIKEHVIDNCFIQVLLLTDLSLKIDAYSYSMTRKGQVDQQKFMKLRLKHPEILRKLYTLTNILESHMEGNVR